MSASLVGSEMCIRDRPPSRTPLSEWFRCACQRHLLAVESGGSSSPTGVPVSYTHLTLPTICSV
eukprot:15344675-Alexandrium_andersonii.AAC.1